jgi:hypothetical protein
MESAREGNAIARAPFGYDRVLYDATGKEVHRVVGNDRFDKPKIWRAKLDISRAPLEEVTVRWIFDQYANTDANTYTLARELNRRGIKTRFDYQWQAQSVKRLLKNPVYTGQMVFGKHPSGRFNRVGSGGIGGESPIVVNDSHPALIDVETFERVQKKMARRSTAWTRPPCNNYVLSGLLICGETGQKLVGRRASVGTGVQYYTINYPSPDNSGTCRSHSIRKDWIEPLIVSRLMAILDLSDLEKRIKDAVARRLSQQSRTTSDVEAMRHRLASLDKKIAKGTERLLLLDDDNLSDAKELLNQWRRERSEVANAIAISQPAETMTQAQEVAKVMSELAKLRETFQQADPAKLRAALAVAIKCIKLYWKPGGPRKWFFDRGVITLGESLLLLVPSLMRITPTRPIPTV